jgi:hypothetical protein
LSNPSEKKHPWAKFKAKPSAPRLPTERALPQARPLPKKSEVVTAAVERPVPVEPARESPALRVSEAPPAKAAGEVARKAEAKRPAAAKAEVKSEARPRAVAAGKESSPAKVPARGGAGGKEEAAPPKPEISAGLASVLSELEKADLDPAVVKRVGRQRDTSPRQRRWMWYGLKDSARNYRRTATRLREWWRVWRTGSSARVVVAFVVVYGLLAVMRKPSEVAVERSRIGEEMAFLQGFLKSYGAAGGPVLAVKPHGGAELYPRGIVLKGEVLNAFGRTPVGGVFAVHVKAPEWNPLEAFYGFPSVYAGGAYFHLDRKINFSLYRCSFLIRKNSEREGTILLSAVERAR